MNTEAEMMQIEATAIIPNHHRDFGINPIKRDQVEKLVKSYTDNNDFGVIPVRLVLVDGEEFYEQASGHHRLDAMRQLGYEWIDCKLLPATTTDADMLSLMIDENAMQYGGDPSHQLDSVAATAKQLAYWMFLAEDNVSCGEISPHELFSSESQFSNAKNDLVNKAIIGRRTISKLIGESLSEDVVRSKMSELQASGDIAKIIQVARDRVDSEAAAREEEERIAEEERLEEEAELERLEIEEKKAAAKREKQRKQLLADQKKAKEKLEKQRILTEQKRAKDEEARQKRLAAVRKKEIARLAEERNTAKQREAKRQADMKKSQAAADEKKRNKTLNPAVTRMFGNTSQVEEFRLLTAKYPALFPVAAQPDYVERMIETLTKTGNLTKRDIVEYMHQDIAKHDKFAADRKAKSDALKEAESASVKARGVAERFRANIGRIAGDLRDIDTLLQSADHRALLLHELQDLSLRKNVDSLEHIIKVLREQGVKPASYDAARDATEVAGEVIV